MKKVSLLLLVLITVLGCARGAYISGGLSAMQGKDISVAFNVLGYPSGQQKIGSDNVYVWTVNHSSTIHLPQTTTAYGHVNYVPVYGSVTYNQPTTLHHYCNIRIIAGPNNVIKTWDYSGNNIGCSRYSNALGRYYKNNYEVRKRPRSYHLPSHGIKTKPQPNITTSLDTGQINIYETSSAISKVVGQTIEEKIADYIAEGNSFVKIKTIEGVKGWVVKKHLKRYKDR